MVDKLLRQMCEFEEVNHCLLEDAGLYNGKGFTGDPQEDYFRLERLRKNLEFYVYCTENAMHRLQFLHEKGSAMAPNVQIDYKRALKKEAE